MTHAFKHKRSYRYSVKPVSFFKSFKIYPQKVKYNSHIKTIINTGTNTANAVVSS